MSFLIKLLPNFLLYWKNVFYQIWTLQATYKLPHSHGRSLSKNKQIINKVQPYHLLKIARYLNSLFVRNIFSILYFNFAVANGGNILLSIIRTFRFPFCLYSFQTFQTFQLAKKSIQIHYKFGTLLVVYCRKKLLQPTLVAKM